MRYGIVSSQALGYDFSAAKIQHFFDIYKFLGEKYAGIGRFRQE
jgi:hypothetical protein